MASHSEGLDLSEIRRALRRGTAEQPLSSTLKTALRKLHRSLLDVRSRGGRYAGIEFSPELTSLLESSGIVRSTSDSRGVARRRQPVHHG